LKVADVSIWKVKNEDFCNPVYLQNIAAFFRVFQTFAFPNRAKTGKASAKLTIFPCNTTKSKNQAKKSALEMTYKRCYSSFPKI
jgi:hypothetical protein